MAAHPAWYRSLRPRARSSVRTSTPVRTRSSALAAITRMSWDGSVRITSTNAPGRSSDVTSFMPRMVAAARRRSICLLFRRLVNSAKPAGSSISYSWSINALRSDSEDAFAKSRASRRSFPRHWRRCMLNSSASFRSRKRSAAGPTCSVASPFVADVASGSSAKPALAMNAITPTQMTLATRTRRLSSKSSGCAPCNSTTRTLGRQAKPRRRRGNDEAPSRQPSRLHRRTNRPVIRASSAGRTRHESSAKTACLACRISPQLML